MTDISISNDPGLVVTDEELDESLGDEAPIPRGTRIEDLIPEGTQRIAHPTIPGVFACFMKITPRIAAHVLKSMEESQRPRSNAAAEKYTADRIAGDWWFNGATLCWDVEGDNIDGQHRNLSIWKSGLSSVELCVFGLPIGTIDRMDLGLPRNFKTWLSRQIKPMHVTTVGATTNMIWNWKRGNYGFNTVLRVPYARTLRISATSPQLQGVFTEYRPEIENAAIQAASIRRRLPINTVTPAVLAFAWLTLRRLDIDKAEEFFAALQKEELRTGDDKRAIRLLFKMMQTASTNKKTLKRDSWVWLHYFYSAWNAWLLQNPPAKASYQRPSEPGPRTVALPLDPNDLSAAPREIFA
jgi:hypothetical protein